MSTKARCKFSVREVTKTAPFNVNEPNPERIKMMAIGSGEVPEDAAFTKYTPSGELTFSLQNPALLGHFEPGQTYYLDLIPVEDES